MPTYPICNMFERSLEQLLPTKNTDSDKKNLECKFNYCCTYIMVVTL